MAPNDLEFMQAPTMGQKHVDAMAWVVLEWPYANVRFDRCLLDEIHAHLTALLAQPVPSREQAFVIVSDPLVTFMKVEAYDFDGTPVTYEGEVTKRSGNYPPPSQTFTSWLKEYSHLDDGDIQSDQ